MYKLKITHNMCLSESLIFSRFVSLHYDASLSPYKHQVSISQKCTLDLIAKHLLHPAFVPNLVGRPDYWAPGVSHDPPTRGIKSPGTGKLYLAPNRF
jgi:hypothetical protein